MFATLLGSLPAPVLDEGGEELDDIVRIAIRAQEAAGLEPITDGRLRERLGGSRVGAARTDARGDDAGAESGMVHASTVVAGWRFAAGETDRAVKQALLGPYSIGWRLAGGRRGGVEREAATERAAATEHAAERLRAVVLELAAAGCPLIEIEETDAHRIRDDPSERALFREAHGRLTDGVEGTHLSLSIVGGSAWGAGAETIFDLPYSSLAVDLIDGPDNWNLVTRLPGDRGVIAGALPAKDSPADAREMLLWAARYAAASNGRGLDRVGIGSAGSWANLTWEAAVGKMNRLGEAARLAATPGGADLARALDPRAVSARAAALGRVDGEPRDIER